MKGAVGGRVNRVRYGPPHATDERRAARSSCDVESEMDAARPAPSVPAFVKIPGRSLKRRHLQAELRRARHRHDRNRFIAGAAADLFARERNRLIDTC